MKKIFLVTILLFQLTFVFGQKTTKWSEWKTSNCFKGLQFSVKRESNEPDKQTNSYWWNIRFKNNYNRKVGFSCTLTIDGEKVINGRWDLSAGSEQSYTSVPCKSGNSIHNVDFSDVCFSDGSFDCAMGGKDKPCYAECDRGIPNIPKDCGGNSSNNQSSSSNNITHGSNGGGYNQQDDQVTKNQKAQRQEAEESKRLTDGTKTYLEYYNRATSAGQAGNYDEAVSNWNLAISVAVNDAQRENAQAWLAEAYKAKNSSNIQRQNQEYANNRQQFINIYNEGVQLGNMGNYNEAAAKYQQAIGLATNDSDRQTAQNAYNKISKANTQQQALTQLSSSIMDFAKSLEAAKEAKRLKREQERLAQEQQQKENELEAAKALEELENKWKIANEYSDLESTEGYQKAIEIMLPYAINNRINASSINDFGYWYWKLKDYKNAIKWYTNASVKGDANATRNLGVLYANGMGVEKNDGKALTYYKKACEKGLEKACSDFKNKREELESDNSATYYDVYNIAETFNSEKDYVKALKYYKKAFNIETVKSWRCPLMIAKMYFNEEQLNDKDSCAKWNTLAINLLENDPFQKNNIGKDNWFDDKYTDALFDLANSVKNKNGKLAIETYLKAVRDGYTGAYTQAGVIYELGLGGVEIDWKQAQTFYEKDAEKKSAKAMNYLGQLFEKGGPNLEKSKSESKKWFKLACKRDKKYCN